MPIISTSFNDVGNSGQVPSIVRIDTDDSLSTVLTTGYLNVLTHQNLPLSENSLALVGTGTGASKAVTIMSMTYSSGDWSLVVMEGYQATGSGAVNSVLGTANRITSSGGNNPVIDIAATYVGQTSITTLGTIATGVWNGTTVAVAHGGTGLTTMTTAYAPVISGTTATGALQVASTGLSTSGFVLTSNGSSAVPSFQAIPTIPSVFTQVAVPVTSAQLKNIVGNSILLLAAPGANKMYRISSVSIEYDYVSAAYANTGSVFYIAYSASGASAAASSIDQNNFTATEDRVFFAYDDTTVTTNPTINVINQGIYLYSSNNMTTGDSPIVIHLTYETITTTF